MDLIDIIEINYLFYRVCICCLKVFTTTCLIYFSIAVGAVLWLISLVLDKIDSFEHPMVVSCRKVVKKYFRMLFWNKAYRRYSYDDLAVSRGDTYIYEVLDDIFENKYEEFDPYALEDSSIGFHKKVIFMNVSGEAKWHDRHIKGLSTLHRSKHCALLEEGRKVRIRADLGVGELELHCKGSVKFMNFGPTITVTCTLSYIQVFMEFKVNSRTGRNGRLTKFAIDDMRGVKIKISGLGPLNWVVNSIINGVTKIFIRFVQNIIADKVEKHIREHISSYQFPVLLYETNSIEERMSIVTTFPETVQIGSVSEEDSDIEVSENISETEELRSTSEADSEIEVPEIEEREMTSEPAPETVAPKRAPEFASETMAPKRAPEPSSETLAPKRAPEPASETLAPKRAPEPASEAVAPKRAPEPAPKTVAPKRTPEPETVAPKRGTEPAAKTAAAIRTLDTAVPERTPGPTSETVVLEQTLKPELETVDSEENSEFELETVDSDENSESELETEDSDETSEHEDGSVDSEESAELELMIVDSEESP